MNHAPKPQIEQHYYIQELIDAQERRSDDRIYHQQKVKNAKERMDIIKDAKPKELKAFYCDTCKEDFMAESIKEVEIDWSNPLQYIAFYRTKCSKGHWCMRHITDVYKDSYWFRSKAVAQDKGSHYKETIQPHETGFNMLYKKI